ncbi:Coq4 family protein [Leptolyngbya sp. FACHB-261]|uniref:Coq4 family protein n=1 Tax=Leptolyngbya sp. FACHB-261 TaxID=2692806 RepID=UPI00168575BA|nr:Coq4 family protein [Leptolyngbya sp. FACHB-261]MBD2099992.1 ubiquinone biosynthesis protein [Leptolyngbya sp. FACHB-261]
METLNVAEANHSEEFQASLMAAILNTFQMDSEADLEHADDFDEINARFSELVNYLVNAPAYQLAVDELQQGDSTARAIIQERYSAPIPPLEMLLNLPQDSLGYVYATSLQAAGLKPLDADPSLFSWERVTSDVSYVEYRYQITHDLWHVVTGFDTSPLGELGLQAFYLAQFRLPSALVALVGGLVGFMVSSPEVLPVLISTLEQGWQMGKTAKQLIAQKWEESWEKPVSQWQEELNIQITH